MTEPHQSNPYQGTKVIVLGASGFIGRWVARALCQRGAQVCLVVRDQAAAEKMFCLYDIRGLIVELDLLDHEGTRALFQHLKPSITFNLAGYGVDPAEREQDEKTAYQTNTALVQTLCESIAAYRNREWGGQDIVHVGSGFEYGAIGGNVTEASLPAPTTMYAKSKLAGTQLFAHCCQAHGLKGVTARPFTVYGPGEHQGRLLSSLLETARTGKSLSMTAGTQKRDFTYVEDVAEGLLRLGLAPSQPGEIVHVATGQLTSVRSFVETAARILRIPDRQLEFGSLPIRHAEETPLSSVAITRLQRLTGWVPPTGVVEGIHKTVDFENLQR